ncbi:MAG: DNA-binding protein Alba [Candidatus Diapherotrites archaeon]|nr:DNA-binding protein Alba [Candidatus Diapherotrites archaeon]
MTPESTVYIGKKGTMAYVLAAVTQINQHGATEITLKARGKAISRAVDVAEILRNKFLTDAKIKDIRISTEEISGDEGNTIKVSAIEIKITK